MEKYSTLFKLFQLIIVVYDKCGVQSYIVCTSIVLIAMKIATRIADIILRVARALYC